MVTPHKEFRVLSNHQIGMLNVSTAIFSNLDKNKANLMGIVMLLRKVVLMLAMPHQHEIFSAIEFKPLIKERKSILERVGDKIQTFINTFIEGMGGSI